MAQFSHPELGGGGQWMQGGMTMVGDMFNGGLQSLVSGLCAELSQLLASQQVFVPLPPTHSFGAGSMASGNAWWPDELGQPSSSGGQNDSRYAYFPHARRLAIQNNGTLSLYDTLDHQIGGVQQQQGGNPGTLSFSSQFGTFTVASLPFASLGSANAAGTDQQPANQQPANQPSSFVSGGYQNPPMQPTAPPNQVPFPSPASSTMSLTSDEIFTAIERLGQLHQQGILSDSEFQTKKAELLGRL